MTVILSIRHDINLETYKQVAWRGAAVRISEDSRETMSRAREAFIRLLDSDENIVVYGVTSGYGQMAHQRFTLEERRAHARQPMRQAAAGFGEPFPQRVVRGIVLARLANFLEGHAAIRPDLADAVADLLNGQELPVVPGEGNISPGEIVPLSHLFAPLSERMTLGEKEGLALVNGSPVSAALLADAVIAARARLDLVTQILALSAEAIRAPLGHYDESLDEFWGDPHDAAARAGLSHWMEGGTEERRPYQAPVSWRILPRVLGQAERALAQAEDAANTSLHSISDNPVFVPPVPDQPDEQHPNGRIFSTGGFHNAIASPALDNLAASWADLALMCDRHVTKLLSGSVSMLPDALRTDEGGYIGCTGFTAASYAEGARHAAQRTFLPGSEGGGFGQNDIALTTPLAWRKEQEAGRCLEACLACLAAVCSQALYATDRSAPHRLQPFVDTIREVFPPITEPRGPGDELGKLKARLTNQVFADLMVR